MTRLEAAQIIEQFVAGTGGTYDWDDFTSVRYKDQLVEDARRECVSVFDRFPGPKGRYCDDEGMQYLLSIAQQLRSVAEGESKSRSEPREKPSRLKPILLILLCFIVLTLLVYFGTPDRYLSAAPFEIENRTDIRVYVQCWLYEEDNVWWTRSVDGETIDRFLLPAVMAETRPDTSFPNDMNFSVSFEGRDEKLSTSSISRAPRKRGHPLTLVVEDTRLIFEAQEPIE